MRSAADRKIAGVCDGISEYLEIDAAIVRLIWVLVVIPVPFVPAFIGYFVARLVMPVAPLPIIAPITIPHSTQVV